MTSPKGAAARPPDGVDGPDEPVGYPSRWESDVILRDGSTVHVRPIRPTDGPAIQALHSRLSAETIYFRFFSPLTTLSPRLLDRFVRVDYVDRIALVAVLGEDIIAVGRYERLPSGAEMGAEAEVAFLVDDAHQGRGLGTMLLEHLAAIARIAGITRFVADTLPENSRMLRVFHEAGFDDQRTFADGVVRVVFPIQVTEASVAAADERERQATARSVRRLLAPTTVALIGASRRTDSLGHQLLRTLLAGEFNGPVYPVHPEASHVSSVRAYPTVNEVPDRVDLAVIAVRAEAVPEVVEQCVRKHVGGLVIISSGFADRDEEGRTVERRLVTEARRNGMRLIGPNCMGIVNTDPEVRLNATFSPMPPCGGIGFIAQSGGLGVVLLDEIARRGLGVSTFVSAGNKADVSGNDLLQYWDEDPATSVVLMYIETFGNPRTFARVARRVSRRKPIVAVKSARSTAGVAASGTHGQEQRQADDAVDALFRHAGVIRTDTLEQLFDVAQVLASQPLPAGRRVAIVGNNGGPGVLAADACSAAGLEVVELSPATQERLRSSMPWQGGVTNPVDLAPDARPDAFRAAIDAVLADERVDSVIALYTSPLAAPVDAVAAAVATAASSAPGKPVIVCVVGRRGLLHAQLPDRAATTAIPSFAFPEAAAQALGRVAEYAVWRRRRVGDMAALDVDTDAVRAVVARVLGRGGGGDASPGGDEAGAGAWLGPAEVACVLHAYGIGVLPSLVAGSITAAVRAAKELGFPVMLAADPGDDATLPPRRRMRLGLGDPAAVRAAWAELDPAGPVRVQAMAGRGCDVNVGVTQDALFGPLVTLGAGGRIGEPSRVRSSRALPLTDLDAADLRREVVGSHRPDGQPWTDEECGVLDDLVQRVGRLVEDVPEVAGLDLAPVVLDAAGAAVAGARLRLARAEPRPERALRRLR
jgi:acyl-CoA synthetase (NDP forming)/GNAT superfamily N-acetyltransferase